MEDISRELEREITQLKPSPYKKKREKKILIIDDFGEIKSAGHLKVLVNIFGVISLVCLLAASGFYYLFSIQNTENKRLKRQVAGLEKKAAGLIAEREVLMARLVISGKEPGIETPLPSAQSKTTAIEKKAGIKAKAESESAEAVLETAAETASKEAVLQDETGSDDENPMGAGQEAADGQAAADSTAVGQQIVAVEKFMVTRDGAKGDLLVRFDIRNMSDKPGGVSGRIFTILKPENTSQGGWLVVPAVKLDKGVPTQYRKGQYFSIAHFKPVKFRIENQAGADFFKKAAIYIFNEEGDLMFENHIDITEKEPS